MFPCMGALRDFRKSLGLTADEVAREARLAQSTVIRIELGEIEPKLTTALKLHAWSKTWRKRGIALEDLLPERNGREGQLPGDE